MPLPQINMGDTFLATCTYRDNSGTPVNLTTAGLTPDAFIVQPDGLASIVSATSASLSPEPSDLPDDCTTWPFDDSCEGGSTTESTLTVAIGDQVANPGQFTVTSDTSTWANLPGCWSLHVTYTSVAGVKTSAISVGFVVQ